MAYERVAEPLRAPFTKVVPDDSGAGETVVARGKGVQWAFGELLSCPICVGTWVSAGLIYGLHYIPGATSVYVTVMGITGVAQIVYEVVEALTWFGRAQRRPGPPPPQS